MLTDELVGLISGIPALELLPKAEIENLVEGAALDYFPRGERILTQGGPRCEQLYVIKRGTVAMSLTSEEDGEIVLDYRGEGEYFGLISAVSGDPPRGNATAEEDTIALLVDRGRLLAVLERHPAVSDRLLKSYFIDFIDKTVEETRRRYSALSNEHRQLFSTPAGDLVRRPPVSVTRDTSIQEGARRMAAERISSLVVTDGDGRPVGIVTDRDLREKVVAEARDPQQPVGRIMSTPLVSVDATAASSEALFQMMHHGIHHLLVTEEGRFRGMLTNHDLMVRQGSSPALLVRQATKAESLERLAECRESLVRTVASMAREGARATDVTDFISEMTEKLIARAAVLCEERLGLPPHPYSLFVLGEAGRRELSLDRRARLGIAFHETGDEQEDSKATAYLARLARLLVSSLRDCGLRVSERCAGEQPARGFAAWRDLFRRWVEAPEEVDCDVYRFLEMRPVTGDPKAIEALRGELLQAIAGSEALRARMAAAAVSERPPLGFLRRFVVATTGEHRHQLDLRQAGLKPLSDSVRILAAERGIASLSTRERISELSLAQGDALANGFEYLQTLRIHRHLARIAEGRDPDDFLDPQELAHGERTTLKETFQLTAGLHDRLERDYGVRARR